MSETIQMPTSSQPKVLTCPTCATALELDESEVRSGEVQCPACKTRFKVMTSAESGPQTPLADDEIKVLPELQEAIFRPIKYELLPWEEKATIMWSWFWRTCIIGVCILVSVGFLGGMFGILITSLVGPLDISTSRVVGFVLGIVISFFATHPIIRLLTASRIGDYQIIILKRTFQSENRSAA